MVHEPGDRHRVQSFGTNWDSAAAYGPQFADMSGVRPVSVVLAAGSVASIYGRGDVEPVHPPRPAATAPPSLVLESQR